MAYDEVLAERLDDLASELEGVTHKKMFGGWGLMYRGNLLIGVIGDQVCARVGPDAYAEALAQPHAREFDFTKRPMKGWVFVAPEGLESDADLKSWFDRCLAFVGKLPPK